MKMIDQGMIASAVNVVKRNNGIFVMPAGIEMHDALLE